MCVAFVYCFSFLLRFTDYILANYFVRTYHICEKLRLLVLWNFPVYLNNNLLYLPVRFIPDDVTFDDKPKDVASEVNVSVYKPKYFTSAAMGTSKVSLQCFHNVFLICLVLLSDFKLYVSGREELPACLKHFRIETSSMLQSCTLWPNV